MNQPSVQFSSVTHSCLTLYDLMECIPPGFPVHHQLWELAQMHVHQVSDAIQPSHPLSASSPSAFDLSQRQGLFQWVSSLHQVAKLFYHVRKSYTIRKIRRKPFIASPIRFNVCRSTFCLVPSVCCSETSSHKKAVLLFEQMDYLFFPF